MQSCFIRICQEIMVAIAIEMGKVTTSIEKDITKF